ncbi:hypothetical protein LSAT2_022951 [Lamellibrachia satsuma]|nr:hypothetical protein LSAT2_022951 [Lamellibrachia satsuma]
MKWLEHVRDTYETRDQLVSANPGLSGWNQFQIRTGDAKETLETQLTKTDGRFWPGADGRLTRKAACTASRALQWHCWKAGACNVHPSVVAGFVGMLRHQMQQRGQ